MVALGREGVSKIEKDLESGNVRCYQYLNGALTGANIGVNMNGILASVAQVVKQFASSPESTKLLRTFGNSISGIGVAITGLQTFVAFQEGEISAEEWVGIISAAFGVAAIILPETIVIGTALVPIAGYAGIISGVVGLASLLFSNNIQSGLYILKTESGACVYIYIGDITTA